MRQEEPPNKEVHAADLAQALSHLKTRTDMSSSSTPDDNDDDEDDDEDEPSTPASSTNKKQLRSQHHHHQRSRSSTAMIYNPQDHGASDLPVVMVEDTSLANDGFDMDVSPVDLGGKKLPTKTSRPPLELME